MSNFRFPLYAEQGPSLSRAGALSGAMTINLLVLGALLLPASVERHLVGPRPPEPVLSITERLVEAAATVVAVPTAPVPPVRPQRAAPTPTAVVPIEPLEPSDPLAPTAMPASVPADAPAVVSTLPAAAASLPMAEGLAYVDAPQPPYPPMGMRKHLEGEVLLRVRVGTDGLPLAVEIARSSGHRVLDDAARRTVLAQWRFRPAMRDGLAVQAVGLVPIVFRLSRG